MSYPKKHPTLSHHIVDTRTQEKLHKREQLKSLLVTKFKTKYGVKGDNNDQNTLIQKEIEHFLQTNNMSEAALNTLD